MRDIILLVFTFAGLIVTLRAPFVGLLLWVLFSIMNPHQDTYSFAQSVPWNLIIAIVTTGAWLASSEPKAPPRGATTALVLALLAWSTFNTLFAFDPSFSWTYWDRAWKTLAMCLLASALTKNMIRFHALMWVVALSLGFYGVKGGLFTLITGGHFIVSGPSGTNIGDNNTLADALVMLLPILNYLRSHSASGLVRIGIVASIILILTSILGSYSREAYIALAVLGVAFWFRSKNKFVYPIVTAIAILPLLHFMPDSFFDRAASIGQYGTDSSFQARLLSWWVAYRYAMDHIPFGAGFYGMNLQGVWDLYTAREMHAAHSIYFQMLGEQGVIGLVLYLLIIANTYFNLRAVRARTRSVPELRWAHDLATMMQLSLVVFCVAGAAVPIDFFDLFFLWVMLSAGLRESVLRQTQTEASREVIQRQVLLMSPLRTPPA